MKILLDDMSCLSPSYGVSGTILKNRFSFRIIGNFWSSFNGKSLKKFKILYVTQGNFSAGLSIDPDWWGHHVTKLKNSLKRSPGGDEM